MEHNTVIDELAKKFIVSVDLYVNETKSKLHNDLMVEKYPELFSKDYGKIDNDDGLVQIALESKLTLENDEWFIASIVKYTKIKTFQWLITNFGTIYRLDEFEDECEIISTKRYFKLSNDYIDIVKNTCHLYEIMDIPKNNDIKIGEFIHSITDTYEKFWKSKISYDKDELTIRLNKYDKTIEILTSEISKLHHLIEK